MADEEKKKKIPLMLIVVMIVVGLALAGGISYFIASKIVADKAGTKVEQREPGTFVKLGDRSLLPHRFHPHARDQPETCILPSRPQVLPATTGMYLPAEPLRPVQEPVL